MAGSSRRLITRIPEPDSIKRRVKRDGSGTTASTTASGDSYISDDSDCRSIASDFSDFEPKMIKPLSTGNLIVAAGSVNQSRRRLTVRFKDDQQAKCRAWCQLNSTSDHAPSLPRSRSSDDVKVSKSASSSSGSPRSKKSSSSKSMKKATSCDDVKKMSKKKKKKSSSSDKASKLWYHKEGTAPRRASLQQQNAVWSVVPDLSAASKRLGLSESDRLTVNALASPASNRKRVSKKKKARRNSARGP